MATPTYDLIASNVLSSSASSVTFSSIPSTYRDLVLVVTAVGTSFPADTYGRVRFNSDTGNNYSYVSMSGTGSSTNSQSGTSSFMFLTYNQGFTGGDPSIVILQINDYSATDKHKSCVLRWSNASKEVAAAATRWASTSAINEILIYTDGANYASGSTFYLYGIAS